MDDVIQDAPLLPLFININVLERRFANFTFEILPNVGIHDRSLLAVTFALKPLFQTAQSDVT